MSGKIMNERLIIIASLTISVLIGSCVKPPNYPDQPVIEYIGLNKSTIAQGNQNSFPDTLQVIFSFTDGDGDIGFPDDSLNVFDAFLIDSRDGFKHLFRLPVLPEQGVGNGVSGEITLRIPNRLPICCTFPDGSTACQPNSRFPTDTMSFAIQIMDRSRNMSNFIQSETITILCQ
jgi:hypothetical protein